MIDCETCGKRHRDEELVAKCKLRAEKRAEREAARQADIERRFKNRKDLPIHKFIARGMAEGRPWEGPNSILSGLKKDYPPPWGGLIKGREWTIWDMIEVDSRNLVKSWGMDFDSIVEARMERHMLGAYVTTQPNLDEVVTTHEIHELDDEDNPAQDGESVLIAGFIEDIEKKTTKTGKPYVTFTLQGYAGRVSVIVFTKTYQKAKGCLLLDRVVFVNGRMDRRFSTQVIADDVWEVEIEGQKKRKGVA